MATKPVVEDFLRIYASDLVRQARFDSTVAVRHHGLLLSVTLSRAGSYLHVRGVRWELVPVAITTLKGGVRWYFLDHTGQRVDYLLVDGDRLGSRWELGTRYQSQRLHSRKKEKAWARKRYVDKLAPSPVTLQFCVDHPDYLPEKPKGRRMYRSRVRSIRRKLLARINKDQPVESLPF
jgi:hypothetical protein